MRMGKSPRWRWNWIAALLVALLPGLTLGLFLLGSRNRAGEANPSLNDVPCPPLAQQASRDSLQRREGASECSSPTPNDAFLSILALVKGHKPGRASSRNADWNNLKRRWLALEGNPQSFARVLLEDSQTSESVATFLAEALIDSGNDASLRFIELWIRGCPQHLRISLAVYYVTHVCALNGEFASWACPAACEAAGGANEEDALIGIRLLGLLQGHDDLPSMFLTNTVLRLPDGSRSESALNSLGDCPPPGRLLRYRELLLGLPRDDARALHALTGLAEGRWERGVIQEIRRLAHDAKIARSPDMSSLARLGQALQLWGAGRITPVDPTLDREIARVSTWLKTADLSSPVDRAMEGCLERLAVSMQDAVDRSDGPELDLIAQYERAAPSATRYAILVALSSRQASTATLEHLSQIAIEDHDTELRALAVREIGYSRVAGVIPLLESVASSDQEPSVRREALVGLALQRSIHADGTAAYRIVNIFVRRLQEEREATVRDFVVSQLSEWADPLGVSALRSSGFPSPVEESDRDTPNPR